MRLPVFDFHCDTALGLLRRKDDSSVSLRRNEGHIDLERAAQLGGYCQCFALFTTPSQERWIGRPVTEIFRDALSALQTQLKENEDLISQACSTEEILANQAAGKMSAVLTLEGSAGIEYDPARLEEIYRIGVRVSSLGWNEQNVLTGSHFTGGGLTDRGREYVRECQRLGILVDVSHISDEGFRDIMDITDAPVIGTHSNLRSVCGVSRNLTEDMFLQICRTGGIAGINLCPDFLAEENASVDSVCDHIFRFLEIDPDGCHLCLGGDLDGIDSLPNGFSGVESFNELADRLLERGLDEKTIQNIYWNNAIGVMNRAVRNHKK